MSCNCHQEETCSSCGDTGISPVICADPELCEEIFQAECVEYTGTEDIKCGEETNELFPDVTHTIVSADGTWEERRLPAILGNINDQLCYIFSKEYIKRVLQIIAADSELSDLFCQITCQCSCNLVCPVYTQTVFNATTLSFTLTNANISIPDPITKYTVTLSSISPALSTTVTGTFYGGDTTPTITLEGDFDPTTDYTLTIVYEYTIDGFTYEEQCEEIISF